MNETILQTLRTALPQLTIRTNVPYKEITSFGIGGTIPVLVEPADDIELSQCFKFATAHNLPVLPLGGGSNLAGMDAGFDGMIIRLCRGQFSEVRAGRTRHLTAGAACRMAELARAAANAGLGGLAPLAGIPGTLGGAIRMNAGANGRSIGEFVTQLCGCRQNGSIWTAEGSEILWSYRKSSIPADVVITSAILRLEPVEPAVELEAISKEIAARRQREPKGRTAGCIFKNPGLGESAGKLIDLCGLKGMECGSVAVSGEHANFLTNQGGGSEQDLLALMIRIRKAVAERFGIYLEPEVVFADPTALQRYHDAVPAPRVAVLMGGASSERDVSLRSGAAVAQALRNAGCDVQAIDLHECCVTPEMRAADVVYPVLHGGFGEDGRIQKELEAANIAFVGSGSASSALVMDKIATKRKLDAVGLPTAPWATISRENSALPAHLNYPVVVKVPCEGSTVGIAKVDNAEEWAAKLPELFEKADELLVEAFIRGTEITVPVIGGEVFPAIEIRSPHGFYDWDAKYVYQHGHTEYFCPVDTVSPEMVEKTGRDTLKFFHEFGCRDILRVDFIIDAAGQEYILEGNSIPGCTATSLVPKSAKVAGVSFERMTAGLVKNALERKGAQLK